MASVLNSATSPTGPDVELPTHSDVRTGVDFSLSIVREVLGTEKYNTKTWGYDSPEQVIHEVGIVFSPIAAQRLGKGESTGSVRAFLLEQISTRLRAIETTVKLITAAVAAIKNRTAGITEVLVLQDKPGVVINGVGDAEISQVCMGLRDLLDRVLNHGDTMKHTDIFYSVLSFYEKKAAS